MKFHLKISDFMLEVEVKKTLQFKAAMGVIWTLISDKSRDSIGWVL